jgi:hypothetical protein
LPCHCHSAPSDLQGKLTAKAYSPEEYDIMALEQFTHQEDRDILAA